MGLAEYVSKMLYNSHGAELTKFTEQQLSQNMVTRCVTSQTHQDRTAELHRIKQEPGQLEQSFLAYLKSRARQCNVRMVYSGLNFTSWNALPNFILWLTFWGELYLLECPA